MRDYSEEIREERIRERRNGLRNEIRLYLIILAFFVATGLVLMGFHIINQLDAVMNQQATNEKTIADVMEQQEIHDKVMADAMDQLMAIRQEVDELKWQNEEFESLGYFNISHYCACEKCCGKWAGGITATGVIAKENHTIAVDPEVIPYGTKVIIDGCIYTAESCGGAIRGKKIDIFVADHNTAVQRGRIEREVHIYGE